MNKLVNNKNYIISFIIILIGFHICYGFKVIDPININWLMSAYHDWGTHYLGWAYFRNEPWGLPLGHIENYNFPAGTNIGFTDSIPLAAVFFKCISFLLPSQFQYFGIWLLICHLLTGYFTIKIVNLYTNSILYNILFGILVAFNPVLIYRGFHPALCAQWLIIASIYYFLISPTSKNVNNINKKQIIIIILSAFINPYLFLMVCGFNIILPVKHFLFKMINLKQTIIYVFVSIFSVLFSWYILGMISLESNTNIEVIDSYGLFSFNLNSFYNSDGFSTFLPQLKQVRVQQYEGYAYYGLGIIILLFFCTLIFLHQLIILKVKWFNWKTVLPIAIITLALAMFSITNKITLNENTIFEFQIPNIISKLGGVFRACGRFIWVFYYTILFLAIFIFTKSNLPNKFKTILLTIIFIIQIVDIKPLLTFRDLSNGNYEIKKISEKKWTTISSKFKRIITYPCFENNLLTYLDYQDFCFIALKNNLPISTGYVARITGDANKIFIDSLNTNLSEAIIPDSDLYITTPKNLDAFTPLIFANKVKLGFLDGYYYLYSKNKKINIQNNQIAIKKIDSIYNEIDRSLKIKTINCPLFKKDVIKYNIEKNTFDNNIINIQGWSYLSATSSNQNDSTYIALTNEKFTYISKSKLIKRPDVTANYKKGNVDNAGFKNTIFTNKIEQGIYQFALAIKDKNNRWSYELLTQIPAIDLKKKSPPIKIKNIEKESQNMIGNVDSFIIQSNKVIISGWGAIKKTNSLNSNIKLILIGDKVNYQIATEKILRPDVTQSNNDHYNYDESGFKINLRKDYFESGNYQIGILVINDNNQKGFFIHSTKVTVK